MPAFLFADIAGFTALTETHGDENATDLIALFEEAIYALLPADSKFVKTIGDAVMVVTPTAGTAAQLAQDLQLVVESLPGRPALRVGIHIGEAVERNNDYWGHAVNVAARVTAAAEPDEILITEPAKDEIERSDDGRRFSYRRKRPTMLRNVSTPIQLFTLDQRTSRLETDPVCRMRLAPDEAAGTLTFGGRTYVFCSLECIRLFAENPETYAAKN